MTQSELFDNGESKLETNFWEFHKSHPEVYEMLVTLTRQWKLRQARRIGIATVFETARYKIDIESSGDGIKLNNNHRAYYARLIMGKEKDLEGIFLLRQQRIEATIGPSNDSLEPSVHFA